jgi:predicted transcriptional regulator of viral defense system
VQSTGDMSLLEKTYAFMLKNRVVKREELKDFAEDILEKNYDYLYRKFIFKLMKQGKVERIRKGLYFARNIYIDEHEIPNKFLIGSKIKSPYYLGYHTAIEIFGSAQSIHRGCYISIDIKNRFKPFQYNDYNFNPVIAHDLDKEIVIRNVENFEVRISSPSRTFVECIQRPDLCIGYEEVYKSLESLGGVEINGLLSTLEMYRTDILYRAVGFFLEELKEGSPYYSHVEEKDLKKIQKKIGNGKSYLIRDQGGEYLSKWRLYIPEGFRDLFLGVR